MGERQLANYFDQFERIKKPDETLDSAGNNNNENLSYWSQFERVNPSQADGNDLSNFDNILNMPNEPTLWDKAGNILQGGVKLSVATLRFCFNSKFIQRIWGV